MTMRWKRMAAALPALLGALPVHGGGLPSGLEPALREIAAASGGTVAVTAVRLPDGARLSVNGDRPLPMMSVFKLPLALVTLASVDAGRRTLDERVPLRADELRHSFSPLAAAWENGETSPTLERVIRTAIVDSDNTSGDKLVTLNGGGPAVTERLRSMGVDGIEVAEQEIEIFARLHCAGTPPPAGGWTDAAVHGCGEPPLAARREAYVREIRQAPNHATTDALAALLVKLARGEVLSQRSRAWLLDAMERTNTGPNRLRAGLPAGTRLAHRTGTGDTLGELNVATNDIGTVHLPDGTQLVLAVLTSGVPGTDESRDAVIARVARTAYEAVAPRHR